MDKRVKKQILVGFIFMLIFASISFLSYFLIKGSPTCDDNIKNQGEQGIDCGGPCAACKPVLKPIEVIWVNFLAMGNNFYDVVAKIKNPNPNHGSGYLPYVFEFYDSKDQLIGQSQGVDFILPNQTKYLLNIKASAPDNVAKVKISFKNKEINWQKLKEDYQPPQLTITQKKYLILDKPGIFSQLSGVVVNKSSFDFNEVDIDVLLFDSQGQLVGLNATKVNALLAGQERYFIVSWFNRTKNDANIFETEAETNIFNSDNFINKYGIIIE
jgi:hypothetical protein